MTADARRPIGQCSDCSIEKPIVGHGLCRACYQRTRDWRISEASRSDASKAQRRQYQNWARRLGSLGLRDRLGRAERVRQRREFAHGIKAESGCVECPPEVVWPPVALDFDHVRGQKVADVSALVASCARWDVLREEIAKCEVVCANHHRMRTAARRSA